MRARGGSMDAMIRWLMISAFAVLAATPVRAMSIRELAKYDQPVLVGHIMGSVSGLAAGLTAAGNKQAADCVHRWAAPPAGNADSKALTDILTRFADTLSRLTPSSRVPDYEEVLLAAARKQCGTLLPSG